MADSSWAKFDRLNQSPAGDYSDYIEGDTELSRIDQRLVNYRNLISNREIPPIQRVLGLVEIVRAGDVSHIDEYVLNSLCRLDLIRQSGNGSFIVNESNSLMKCNPATSVDTIFILDLFSRLAIDKYKAIFPLDIDHNNGVLLDKKADLLCIEMAQFMSIFGIYDQVSETSLKIEFKFGTQGAIFFTGYYEKNGKGGMSVYPERVKLISIVVTGVLFLLVFITFIACIDSQVNGVFTILVLIIGVLLAVTLVSLIVNERALKIIIEFVVHIKDFVKAVGNS